MQYFSIYEQMDAQRNVSAIKKEEDPTLTGRELILAYSEVILTFNINSFEGKIAVRSCFNYQIRQDCRGFEFIW